MKQVVAGWGHTAVLAVDGTVYMCGRNEHGQLGLGDPSVLPVNERGHHFQPFLVPVHSLEPHRVAQVACGGEHSLFLTDDHLLLTTGRGNCGQLGQQSAEDFFTPVKVPMVSHAGREILQVACGDAFSLVLVGQYQPLSLTGACIQCINKSEDLLMEIKESLRDEGSIIPNHLLNRMRLPDAPLPAPPMSTLTHDSVHGGESGVQEGVKLEGNCSGDSVSTLQS